MPVKHLEHNDEYNGVIVSGVLVLRAGFAEQGGQGRRFMAYIRVLLLCVVCLLLAGGCSGDSAKPSGRPKPNSPTPSAKSDTQKTPNSDDAELRKELKILLSGRTRPTASVFLQRAGSATVPESDAWRELIQALRPDVEKKQAGIMMLELDPLFKEDGTFQADISAKYRRRFKSIPQPAIKAWVDNNEGYNDVAAAMMLMQINPLFDNDQFQSSRLDSALRILKELKDQKDK